MPRYIDADALLESAGGLDKIFSMIPVQKVLDAPALDVTPVVHGGWCCVQKNPYRWKCSRCNAFMPTYGTDEKASYCPNCGAKMWEGMT